MNEFHLILKDSHIFAILAGIFVIIFKPQLLAFSDTFIVTMEIKLRPGDHVEIMYMDGQWTRAKILKFTYTIPFYRIGGIYLEHDLDDGKTATEKLSYHVFRYCRKRWLPGKK